MSLFKIVLIISYVFWSIVVFYAIVMLAFFNDFTDFFKYSCKDIDTFDIVSSDDQRTFIINYYFDVNGKVYHGKESCFQDVFYQRMGNLPSRLVICFNSSFPKFNYVKGIDLKRRDYYLALMLGGLGLLLTILGDLFGKKKKMVIKYEKVFFGE